MLTSILLYTAGVAMATIFIWLFTDRDDRPDRHGRRQPEANDPARDVSRLRRPAGSARHRSIPKAAAPIRLPGRKH